MGHGDGKLHDGKDAVRWGWKDVIQIVLMAIIDYLHLHY